MLHPKASCGEFKSSLLLSLGHSLHVWLGKELWKLENIAGDAVGCSELKGMGDGEPAAGELRCTEAPRRE